MNRRRSCRQHVSPAKRVFATFALSALTAVAAGCDDGRTNLTRSAFIARAESICRDANASLLNVPEYAGLDPLLDGRLGLIFGWAVDDLRRLTPPHGFQKQFDAAVDDFSSGLDALDQSATFTLLADGLTGESLTSRQHALRREAFEAIDRARNTWTDYGLRACGSDSGLFHGEREVIPGCIKSFAWSPNGASIAFSRLVADDAPDAETGVVSLVGGRMVLLAKDGRPEPPSWSPDGTRIAFPAEPNDIYVASSMGGSVPRRIASGYWPVWSPDGQHIAFTALSDRIAIVRPDGSGLRYITRSGSTGAAVPVVWLPDGRRLLFAGPGTPFAGMHLNIVNVDGTGLRRVAATAGGTQLYAVSPASGRIAYSTDRGIFVVRPDGSGKRLLARGAVGGWSPGGNRLAFTNRGLYVINADGTRERRVAARASVGGIGSIVASWSSSGQIAFIVNSEMCGGPG